MSINLLGQHCVLQDAVIDDLPAQAPPQDSVTVLVLVLVLSPPPHVFEQLPVVQALHAQFPKSSPIIINVFSLKLQ